MSCSEGKKKEQDECGRFRKTVILSKLLSTPLEEDSAAKDGLGEIEEVAIKKKRYEVSHSGPEVCLL